MDQCISQFLLIEIEDIDLIKITGEDGHEDDRRSEVANETEIDWLNMFHDVSTCLKAIRVPEEEAKEIPWDQISIEMRFIIRESEVTMRLVVESQTFIIGIAR